MSHEHTDPRPIKVLTNLFAKHILLSLAGSCPKPRIETYQITSLKVHQLLCSVSALSANDIIIKTDIKTTIRVRIGTCRHYLITYRHKRQQS